MYTEKIGAFLLHHIGVGMMAVVLGLVFFAIACSNVAKARYKTGAITFGWLLIYLAVSYCVAVSEVYTALSGLAWIIVWFGGVLVLIFLLGIVLSMWGDPEPPEEKAFESPEEEKCSAGE